MFLVVIKILSLTINEKYELSVFRNTLLRINLVPLKMRCIMAANVEASLLSFAIPYPSEPNAWFIITSVRKI